METHFLNIEHAHTTLARERVMADLRSLVRDAEDLLRATASDASDKAREARERLASALDRARRSCQQWQEQTRHAARNAVTRADTTIRSHPYEAIGLAFGLGLLIGTLALGSEKRSGD